MNAPVILDGRSILLVEDEYFIVDEMRRALEAMGATIIGPAPSVAQALDVVASAPRIDAAVLDVNLQGEMVYPVADALFQRGVPFIFATGYDDGVIDARFADITRCEKPVDPLKVARALFG
jgi:CheY-like chemotaxis protein